MRSTLVCLSLTVFITACGDSKSKKDSPVVTDPAQASKPAQPAEPAQPAQPAEPAQPAQPVLPGGFKFTDTVANAPSKVFLRGDPNGWVDDPGPAWEAIYNEATGCYELNATLKPLNGNQNIRFKFAASVWNHVQLGGFKEDGVPSADKPNEPWVVLTLGTAKRAQVFYSPDSTVGDEGGAANYVLSVPSEKTYKFSACVEEKDRKKAQVLVTEL